MMKRLLFLFLVSPFVLMAQSPDDLVFDISTFTASPTGVAKLEAGLTAHNNKYHASGAHGVRVYSVSSGRDSGKYKWVMGPHTWKDLDGQPAGHKDHDTDWNEHVEPYLMPESNTEYIRLDRKYSYFNHDFKINKLLVWYWDVKRNADWEKINLYLGNIRRVFAEKLPNEVYGVYHNELGSTKEGRDLTMVFFFDSFAWMGLDNGFDKKYEEIFGAGSWKTFLNDWEMLTNGRETELWEYRGDLGGQTDMVQASDRQ